MPPRHHRDDVLVGGKLMECFEGTLVRTRAVLGAGTILTAVHAAR